MTATFRFDIEPRLGEVVKRTSPRKHRRKLKRRNSKVGESGRIDSSRLINNVNGLGIPQLELFALFTKHRGRILNWLQDHPDARNQIMEETVRIVTNNKRGDSMQYNTRMWKSVDAPHCIGRYVPDTEAIALQEKREGVQADTFAEWLRLTTNLAVDTEVNIQLGEFTLKKHRVEPIDERFRGFGDFAAVFGRIMAAANGGVQCAEVKNTTQRLWVRLVGRRHDLQLWKPDRRSVDKPCGRLYPSRLGSNERWILDAIKPSLLPVDVRQRCSEVYLPDAMTPTNATFVRMCYS